MWDGAIVPLKQEMRKHYLGTGSLANHIELLNWNYDDVDNKIFVTATWIGTNEDAFTIVLDNLAYSGNEEALTDASVKAKLIARVF